MDIAVTVAQVVIALGIVNVWIVRYAKATAWRGGTATTLEEEFRVYGLPRWFMTAVGVLKLGFAVALLVGLFVPAATRPAAIGMAVLMLGAVAMHVKVKDPLKRSLPALAMLTMAVFVAVAA